MSLAERLIKFRIENALSPAEMADLLDIQLLVYYRYERKAFPVKQETIDKMAELLGCTVEELGIPDRKPRPTYTRPTEKKEPQDYMLGLKLRKLRTAKGFTCAYMARELGVSGQTYANYEHGNTRPRSMEAYRRLAEILGCDMHDLLGDETDGGKTGSETTEPEQTETAETVEISDSSEAEEAFTPCDLSDYVEFQFGGQTATLSDIVKKAQVLAGSEMVDIYIKPEEHMVYTACNGVTGSFPL